MAKLFYGVVSSNSPNKTIVVTVQTRKTHPLYKKQYSESKRFMVHDENNEALIGDKVTFQETRPLSARKRHTLVKIVEKAAIAHEVTPDELLKEELETSSEKKQKDEAQAGAVAAKPKPAKEVKK